MIFNAAIKQLQQIIDIHILKGQAFDTAELYNYQPSEYFPVIQKYIKKGLLKEQSGVWEITAPITEQAKQAIFQEFYKCAGEEFINNILSIRRRYYLSDYQFYYVYREWERRATEQ